MRAGSQGSDLTRESRLLVVRFDPWESALRGWIWPVRAGSHGSDLTRESQLSGVGFDLWEPAFRGQIWPVRVGSQGFNWTRESQLSGVRFYHWESALRDRIWPFGKGSSYSLLVTVPHSCEWFNFQHSRISFHMVYICTSKSFSLACVLKGMAFGPNQSHDVYIFLLVS